MKKTLIVTLLILSSMFSLANARFFIGIDGGLSADIIDVRIKDDTIYGKDATGSPTTTKIPGSFTANAYKGNGYLFNLNLGTQHHFDEDDFIGFRWLLNLGYGRTDLVYQENENIHFPSHIIEATLGADILLDVDRRFKNASLGVFIGAEGGVLIALSDAKTYDEFPILSAGTLGATARVGLSLFLEQHHRIELVGKFLVKSWEFDNNTYKPIQFMLGYKFVF